MVTVIGATNIDIIATTLSGFAAHDSNPSRIVMGVGGVGKNYAHNLSLLGENVQFITLFGDDYLGDLAKKECKRLGFDLHLSATPNDARSSMFLCVNNTQGQMQAGAADVAIIEEYLTPAFLETRIDDINRSQLVLFDANLPVEAMVYLLDNCTVPMMADTVSSKKAVRIAQALQEAQCPRLHTLKLNKIESQHIFGAEIGKDPHRLLTLLHDLGVEHIYITDGARGVTASSAHQHSALAIPSLPPARIVDTNGCGDAFISGLAFAFLQGVSFPDCTQYGLMASKATIEVSSVVNPNLLEELSSLNPKTRTLITDNNESVSITLS